MSKYLDDAGVAKIWEKIKSTFVAKENNKGLSTNDFTTTLKNKLDGLSNYSHPSYATKASGLYKITVDKTGHVSEATAVTKADITNLGIPGSTPDLSGYIKKNEMVAITDEELEEILI